MTKVERGAESAAWWEVHVPSWAGIVILTVIVTALTGFLPELVFLILWPLTVLVPPVTTYVRALQRSWGMRARRGAFWSAAASVVIAVAMVTLQIGRMTNPEPGRAQYLAANVIGFGLPVWFLWALWDTLRLFRHRRTSR